jgi:hypothetical protein
MLYPFLVGGDPAGAKMRVAAHPHPAIFIGEVPGLERIVRTRHAPEYADGGSISSPARHALAAWVNSKPGQCLSLTSKRPVGALIKERW